MTLKILKRTTAGRHSRKAIGLTVDRRGPVIAWQYYADSVDQLPTECYPRESGLVGGKIYNATPNGWEFSEYDTAVVNSSSALTAWDSDDRRWKDYASLVELLNSKYGKP